MTDLRKAAEVALETLVKQHEWMVRNDGMFQIPSRKAIEALRQALAQPESDCYGYASRLATYIWEKHYKEDSPEWKPFNNLEGVLTQIDNMVCGLVKAQPEQEPDTVMAKYEFQTYAAYKTDGEMKIGVVPEHTAWVTAGKHTVPLYTAPPKREWVGLTDEEVESWRGNYDFFDSQLVREVEAKLKEKNT